MKPVKPNRWRALYRLAWTLGWVTLFLYFLTPWVPVTLCAVMCFGIPLGALGWTVDLLIRRVSDVIAS